MDAESAIIKPESWLTALPIQDLFDPKKPLEVDIGCGKGRFILARAAKFPNTTFLGIDRLLIRLRKISKKAIDQELSNIHLLRIEAAYAVYRMLPENSVSAFYLFFPDPWPKRRHHRRRIFDTDFLENLCSRLKSGGHIHVATDHLDYFAAMNKRMLDCQQLTQVDTFVPPEDERTDFEIKFMQQNLPIGRASFCKTLAQ